MKQENDSKKTKNKAKLSGTISKKVSVPSAHAKIAMPVKLESEKASFEAQPENSKQPNIDQLIKINLKKTHY